MAIYTSDFSSDAFSDRTRLFEGDRFEGINFKRLKIRAFFQNCVFIDCTFRDTKFWLNRLEEITFDNCRMYECNFYARMLNVSFPRTEIESSYFEGDGVNSLQGLDFRGSVLKELNYFKEEALSLPLYPPFEV